jgi:hypothetical protein
MFAPQLHSKSCKEADAMTVSTISEHHDDEILAPGFSDDALELAAEISPLNRASIMATFNDPTQLCC